MTDIRTEIDKFTFKLPILHNNDLTIDFLFRHNILLQRMGCTLTKNCNGILRINNNKSYKNGKMYRCNICRNATSIKNGNKWLKEFNIAFNVILNCIYAWISDYTMEQVIDYCEVSEKTYLRFKELLIVLFRDDQNKKIGGPGNQNDNQN